MARGSELRVVISGDSRGLHRAFAQAEVAAGRFGTHMESATGRATRAMKMFATGGAAALGLGIGAMVKAGVDFEQQMAAVKAVTQDTTLSLQQNAQNFKQLAALAQKMGAQTKFSAGDAAGAMYVLGQQGLKATDMLSGLPAVMQLAAATGETLNDSATTLTETMHMFGLRTADMPKIADMVTRAMNDSALTMEKWQVAMAYVGPVAKTTGISLHDVSVALEIMSNKGIAASTMGTSMRMTLLRLVDPPKKAMAAMQDMGLSTDSFVAKSGKLKPLPKILDLIAHSTEKMTAAQRFSTIANLTGVHAVSGFMALLDGSRTKWDKLSKSMDNSTGSAKRASKIMNDTVKSQFDNLAGSIETVADTLLMKFSPQIRAAIGVAQRAVNSLPDFASAIQRRFGGGDKKKYIDPMNFMAGAGSTRSFSQALGGMLTDAIKGVPWAQVGQTISAGFAGALKLGDTFASQVSSGIGMALSHVNGAKLLGGLVEVVGQAINALFSPAFWIKHFGAIFSIVTLVIPVAKILKIPGAEFLFKWISKPFFGAITKFGGWFLRLFGKSGEEAVAGFLGEIEKVSPKLASLLLNLVTLSGRSLRGVPAAIARPFKDAAESVARTIGGATGRIVGRLGGWIVQGARKLLGGVPAFLGVAKSLGLAVLRGLDASLGGLPSTLARSLAATTAKMRAWVGNFTTAALDIGRAIVKGVIDGIGAIGHAIWSKLSGGISWAGDQIKHAPGKIKAILGIGDGVGAAVVGAAQAGGGSGPVLGPATPGRGSLDGANSFMQPFANIAAGMGLSTTSGKRAAGTRTASGGLSLHSLGDAIDESGPAAEMMRYAQYLVSRYGPILAELIHTPLGFGIKNGRRVPLSFWGSAINSEHYNHVHVGYLGRGGGAGAAGDGKGVPARLRRNVGDGIGEAVRAARSAGFSGSSLVDILAIAGAESKYRNSAHAGPNKIEDSRGMTQINTYAHPWAKSMNLYNSAANFRAAYRVYRDSGFGAWSTWPGKAAGYMQRASMAAQGKNVSGGSLPGFGHSAAGRSSRAVSNDLFRGAKAMGSTAPSGGPWGWNVSMNGWSRPAIGSPGTVNPDFVSGSPQNYESGMSATNLQIAQAGQDTQKLIRAKEKQRAVIAARAAKIRQALKNRKLSRPVRLRLQNELADLIGSANQLDDDLGQLKAPPAPLDAGEVDPGPTRLDYINADIANASLTKDTADDISAAGELVQYSQDAYTNAKASGDPRLVSQAASDLKSAQDSYDQLVQAQQDTAAALQANTDALNGVKDQLATLNTQTQSVNAVTAAQSLRSIADLMSGQIFGRTQQRMATAGSGVGVRIP